MRLGLLLLGPLSLVACGSEEPAAPAPSAPAVEAPAAAPAEAPAAGEATTAEAPGAGEAVATTPPAATGQEGEVVPLVPPAGDARPLDLPSFSTLVGSGESVTVTVHLDGASWGELSFQTIDEGVPTMVHVEIVEGQDTVQVKAPAAFGRPLFISFNAAAQAGVTPSGQDLPGRAQGTPASTVAPMAAGHEQGITLSGQDVELTLVMGQQPEWLKNLSRLESVPFGGRAPGASAQGG